MADRRGTPILNVGEELRRIIAARRRRRRHLGLATLIGGITVPLGASILWKAPTFLVWNASASAPVGLYRVHAGTSARRGDMVVAWTPEPARTLAAKRHYLPANVPLVKRVAAVAGDRVCAAGSAIVINGRKAAIRLTSDAAGRPMPWWTGCRLLGSGEHFLMMDSRTSFDGRYFGVTTKDGLVGRAVLLWAKPAKGSNDG